MPLRLLALLLMVFALTTGEFLIVGILPDVSADLAVTTGAAGLAVTAYAIGMIAGGPILTLCTSRLGRKPVMIGLAAVSIIGNVASALSPNLPVLLLSRTVAGSVVATFFAMAVTTAASLAPAGRSASGVARIAVGMSLGMIVGAPAGTLIGQQVSWRASFVAVAAVTLLALILVITCVPALPPAPTTGSFGDARILARRDMQLAIALGVLGNIGVLMVFTYLAPLLTTVSGFAANAVPALLLVYGVGAVLGNMVGGRLSDRWLLPSLAGVFGALTAVLGVFWAFVEIPSAAVVLTFTVGMLALAQVPGLQILVMSASQPAATLGVAVNASAYQIAVALAGWSGGLILDAGIGAGTLLLIATAPTAAACLLAIALESRRRHRVVSGESLASHDNGPGFAEIRTLPIAGGGPEGPA